MNRLGIVGLPLLLVVSGCPFYDQTEFWHRNGGVFAAKNVEVYHVNIAFIALRWHEGSNSAVLNADEGKVIWKVSPVRPVQFAGFSFELFKTPPGFKVDIDNKSNLPHTGVFSVEVRCMENNREAVLLYYEFSAESLARLLK